MTAIVEFDPLVAESLKGALGPEAALLPGLDALRTHLGVDLFEDCVVLGPSVDQQDVFALAEEMRVARPSLGVVMVRRRIDTAILSDALRAGVREVVQERDLSGLSTAVRRQRDIAARLRESVESGDAGSTPSRHGRVVTVFSAKGGCGKTTLATNLAASLADSGKGTVALVDLDLAFGDVAIALQLFPTHTIADAVALGEDLDGPALAQLLTSHRSGLQALVAPMEPSMADTIDVLTVTRVIDILRDEFDYVVIDTPPALDDNVLAAFDRRPVREPNLKRTSSVHAALLENLGPQLYDSRLTQAELEQKVRVTLQEVLAQEETPLTTPDRARSPRRSPTTSSATARSSRSCATRTSPRSWSTAPTRSTSSARPRSSPPTDASPTRRTCAARSTRSWPGRPPRRRGQPDGRRPPPRRQPRQRGHAPARDRRPHVLTIRKFAPTRTRPRT
jgi:Mrp family chromosome partitioning ATPase